MTFVFIISPLLKLVIQLLTISIQRLFIRISILSRISTNGTTALFPRTYIIRIIIIGNIFIFQFKSRDYQGKRVIPHTGPLTKVIPLELFFDVVPSFPRMLLARCVENGIEFLETTGDEMARKRHYICLISSHSRDILCPLSRLFVRPGIRLFCAVWLFIIWPLIRF